MSNNLPKTWTWKICDGNDQLYFIIFCPNDIKSAKNWKGVLDHF